MYTYDRMGLHPTGPNAGADYYSKFGYNAAVGAAAFEPVWAESGVAVPYPSVAQALTLSSASANDAAAGTGMRTVSITWLDANFEEQTTVLGLNGQTAVALGTGFRVNRVFGLSYGSGLANAGIVYVGYGALVAGKPASVLASIVAGENQTLQMAYCVPAGYTFVMTSADVHLANGGEARLYQRPFGLGFRITRVYPVGTNGGDVSEDYGDAPLVFAEKTDIEMRAKATAATIVVGAEFRGLLFKNP